MMSNSMVLAPIIVFGYNRPELIRQTLDALSRNYLADESTLYVFCDGPKEGAPEEQLRKIEETRAVVRKQDWCKELHVVEAEKNKGLGSSIIFGVTEVVNKHGMAIILEDDLITSPAFLTYMNSCLNHYRDRKSVFSVTALSRPHPERFFPKDYPYDVYCSLKHHPWGWATWADRWNQVDWSADAYKVMRDNPVIQQAFTRMGEDEWDELELQLMGKKNIWSARFALAHFVNHAVSIAPIEPYVRCIGSADSTNCQSENLGRWEIPAESVATKCELRLLDILYEDPRIINSWYSFFKKGKRGLLARCKNWYGRKFLHRDEYALKGKVYDY